MDAHWLPEWAFSYSPRRSFSPRRITTMQRPVSVTVFGILNIAFAVLGVFAMIGTIALFSLPGASNHPIVKIMQESPAYATWLKLTIPLGLMASVALLVAGIGLLRLKSWGRKLSIGYAIYA